jgi:SanA protein
MILKRLSPGTRRLLLSGILCCLITIWLCDRWVKKGSEGRLYHEPASVPYHKAALLLGTSRLLGNGHINQYFANRIHAAAELYRAGKISCFIISGDNSRKEYNEPEDMKQALIAEGIPDTVIYLDFAGFRTNDSVIRCKEIFGQDSVTIISQEFHNERAIMIASAHGIHAIGFNAEAVNAYTGFRTNVRELLARVKLFVDLKITKQQPKFMGEKVLIK